MCLDYLYYVSAHRVRFCSVCDVLLMRNQGDEFDWDYSPMWRFVGRYARFTPEITKLAQTYVNRAVGLPDDAPTPSVRPCPQRLLRYIPTFLVHLGAHPQERLPWLVCGGRPYR